MDNNKFVFNLEWYAVLLEYPAEVRFEVYEAIMRYASSGTLSEMKPLAKMAFSFIRKEMDYNRERYESTIEKRREAGRKGAEKTNGKLRQSSAKAANADDAETESANLGKPRQTPAKPGINNNVNDNVNDNKLSSTTTRARERAAGVEEIFIENFFQDTIAIESFCMNNKISPEELRRIAEEIMTEWKLTGETHGTEKEARRHLLNQARIKINSKANDTAKKDRYARHRGTDSAARSPEDYSEQI